MAQAFTVQLARGQNIPWGFRLQGGKDFSTPLSVQKVNPDSLAEKAGLQTGDAILKIGNVSTDEMKHKDAQDAIVKAGNNFDLLVQRGAVRIWKPSVTPLPVLKSGPKQPLPKEVPLVTKTSLAANKQEFHPIGSKFNTSAKPFGNVEINGSDGRVTALVHNQYNSPAPLYSMQNIADTLTAQAEVLSTGAVGFNFMKKDKEVNKDSAVYKMVLEEERTPTPDKGDDELQFKGISNTQDIQSRSFKTLQMALNAGQEAPPARAPVTRSVEAPVAAPISPGGGTPHSSDNVCADCGRVIIGVFVRVKDKSLHAECFKCTTCGASLRNVGYYSINDKLYCDIHARQVAQHNPPSPHVVAVTVPHGGHLPKDVSIVGTSYTGAVHGPSTTSYLGSPNISGPSPFQASKTVHDTPYKHPVTAPAGDLHKPLTGGSKFVWPPNKPAEQAEPPSAEVPLIETAPSPTIPTYRPPPTTQHVQFTSAKFKQSPQQQQQQHRVSSPATSSTSPIPKSASPVTSAYSPKPYTPTSPLPSSAGVGGGPFSYAKPASSVFAPSPKQTPTAPTSGAARPAPRRGRGILTQSAAPGIRIPICAICGTPIRGPFVTALGKFWCPEHFHCVNAQCRRPLQDIGFVEEQGQLYCEHCYETYLAPVCSKCGVRIKGDCLNAIGKQWHPECFVCAYCSRPFGNSHFYLEDGLPYCEKDWNELFTTKCVGCGYPIEAGDRWVEALNSNYHSQCFKCTICQKNLEGQSFYAKGGRPFCKTHAR